MKYARIVNGHAVDVRTESPVDCFTAEIVAEFVEVPDAVENGWVITGGKWSLPSDTASNQKPVTVSPVEFKLLFTSAERVAIKAARASDPVIDDFFDIVEDSRLTLVDLGLQSTKDAIDYLESKALITAERKAEILKGVVV